MEDIMEKNTFFQKKKKKKFQPALFSPLGRSTGNNFLFKSGLRVLPEHKRKGNVYVLSLGLFKSMFSSE